jgi:capsular polysaccharide transport system permease protein
MKTAMPALGELPAADQRGARELRDLALTASAPVSSGGPLVRTESGLAVAVRHNQCSADWSSVAGRRRSMLLWSSFVIIVAAPALVAAVYLFGIAADQYVAEFRFALHSGEPVRNEPGGLLQAGAGLSPISVDSYAVVQYLGSRDVIADLGGTLDLRAMFSRSEADWLARLEPSAPIETLIRYWRGQVDAFFDTTNGTVVVKARAFTPHDALSLAQGILTSSEKLVNELSVRARHDALRSSEQELRSAERRLKTALARLREFRDKEGIIDPRKTADATIALAGRVRDELVRADTELATLRQYMRSNAPSVRMLEARIQSLEAQRRSVESEITDTEKTRSETLSRVIGSYEQLESEKTFAEKAYQHALEALDRSRANADRQQIYIADFVQPSLPEEALYPRRVPLLGVILVISFAAWAMGGLTVRSVRDHL